ncbi:MAG: NAD(P)H-dependent oxidoreductase [Dehalococcoidia bacterium]|nr:NAD(P)H-dependent oxidoreductase [Dehalococcoidia bacterium]
MSDKITIIGFAGSLRKDSYNKSLLKASGGLMPGNSELETFDLEGIPPFNQDMENSMPEKVKEFKRKIKAADAILIVTPEHNYSVPGVLKNAIDWASRPYGDNAFDGKPAAIMSASPGILGGARGQYQLRQIMVFLNMFPLNKPELFVNFTHQKFDEKGNLTDEKTKEYIKGMLEALVTWTKKLKADTK